MIEVDPARRVKLRIEYERLAEMHPSDLAEILEDLPPAERDAVFTSLDEDVAAEALEEVDPEAAEVAARKAGRREDRRHCGGDGSRCGRRPACGAGGEQSDAILEEMEPEERQEVEELLEFDERLGGRLHDHGLCPPEQGRDGGVRPCRRCASSMAIRRV